MGVQGDHLVELGVHHDDDDEVDVPDHENGVAEARRILIEDTHNR